MRVNEENKHLIQITEKHSLYMKMYNANLSDERKKENNEKAKQYYQENKEKLNTQRKVNYYKKKLRKSEQQTIKEIQQKTDKQKQKLAECLEKLSGQINSNIH